MTTYLVADTVIFLEQPIAFQRHSIPDAPAVPPCMPSAYSLMLLSTLIRSQLCEERYIISQLTTFKAALKSINILSHLSHFYIRIELVKLIHDSVGIIILVIESLRLHMSVSTTPVNSHPNLTYLWSDYRWWLHIRPHLSKCNTVRCSLRICSYSRSRCSSQHLCGRRLSIDDARSCSGASQDWWGWIGSSVCHTWSRWGGSSRRGTSSSGRSTDRSYSRFGERTREVHCDSVTI